MGEGMEGIASRHLPIVIVAITQVLKHDYGRKRTKPESDKMPPCGSVGLSGGGYDVIRLRGGAWTVDSIDRQQKMKNGERSAHVSFKVQKSMLNGIYLRRVASESDQ